MNPGLRGEAVHTRPRTARARVSCQCIGDARTDYSEHFSAFQRDDTVSAGRLVAWCESECHLYSVPVLTRANNSSQQ